MIIPYILLTAIILLSLMSIYLIANPSIPLQTGILVSAFAFFFLGILLINTPFVYACVLISAILSFWVIIRDR